MFALHNLPDGAGLPAAEDAPDEQAVGKSMRVTLPPMQNLSADRLQSDGVFMLENSLECVVWIGRATSPQVLQALFGIPSLDEVDFNTVALLEQNGSDLAARVRRLVTALEEERNVSLQIHLVREGDQVSRAGARQHANIERHAPTHPPTHPRRRLLLLSPRSPHRRTPSRASSATWSRTGRRSTAVRTATTSTCHR